MRLEESCRCGTSALALGPRNPHPTFFRRDRSAMERKIRWRRLQYLSESHVRLTNPSGGEAVLNCRGIELSESMGHGKAFTSTCELNHPARIHMAKHNDNARRAEQAAALDWTRNKCVYTHQLGTP